MNFDWYLERYYRSSEKLKKIQTTMPDQISVAYGHMALDPYERIKSGLTNNYPINSAQDLKLKFSSEYIPIVETCPLHEELIKILKNSPSHLAPFEALNPWEKLEFLELYFGLTTSHTTLEFQPIDFQTNSP